MLVFANIQRGLFVRAMREFLNNWRVTIFFVFRVFAIHFSPFTWVSLGTSPAVLRFCLRIYLLAFFCECRSGRARQFSVFQFLNFSFAICGCRFCELCISHFVCELIRIFVWGSLRTSQAVLSFNESVLPLFFSSNEISKKKLLVFLFLFTI